MVWERYIEVNSNQQDCPVDEKNSYNSEANSVNSDPGLKSPEFEAHVPDDFESSSVEDDSLTVEEFVLVEDVSLVKLEDPDILASLKSSDSNFYDHRKLMGSVEVEAKQGRGRRRKSIPKKTKVADEMGSCHVWQITKWLLSEDKEHLGIFKLEESCGNEENCTEIDDITDTSFEKTSLLKNHESPNTDICDEVDRDGFTCHYCSKSFYDKKVLERHIIIAHLLSAKNNYPCVECDAVQFKYKTELIRHMKTFHSICGICYESYDPEEGLKKHLESHISEMIFSCNQCQKGFSEEKDLEQHLLTHRKMYACTLCPRKFYIKSLFNSHMQSHSGENPFQCKQCMESFATKQMLRIHVKVHTGENPFQCKRCLERFPCYSVLQMHLKIHERKRSFFCKLCVSTFMEEEEFVEHQNEHALKGEGFVCKICTINFMKKEEFVKHRNEHALKGEGSSFICSKCDVNYTSKSEFVAHLKVCTITESCIGSNTSVKNKDIDNNVNTKKAETKSPVCTPRKKATCPKCSKTFTLKRRLLLHLRLHETN